MNEDTITKCLVRDRFPSSIVMPRFTPAEWWECDVCEITKAGYWVEYEIKLTVADFRRDSEKQREIFPRNYAEPPKHENKHELLAGSERGPSRFFYVAPVGILSREPLPPWAGLMEWSAASPGHPGYARTVVEAPRRHKRKDEAMRARLHEAAYWRFHRL